MSATMAGEVQSHTIIRVPGRAHAAAAPFVLLLVALDDGRRVLGHFAGSTPPRIGARVMGTQASDKMIFSIAEETS